MKLRCSKQELFLVVAAVVMGFVLRASKTERLAVEHFDEGVYVSATWYDAIHEAAYPMRHLYAPPLLPKLIRWCSAIPGMERIGPFLPSILMGGATVLLVWWIARTWFGMNAGLFVVFVAALSDFHILLSRMALTDVPMMFWTLLAVGLGARSLHGQSVKGMVVAGICVGIAWWIKYTGWLGLAIITSGSGFWWVIRGHRQVSLLVMLKLLSVLWLTAAVVWSPWYFLLQDHGGYAAVAANHVGYFRGFDGWQDRMARHILYHFRFDSWLGAFAIGTGVLAAGTRRWIELRRSTWNLGAALTTVDTSDDTSISPTMLEGAFPDPALLARFIGAAVMLAVVSAAVGSVGLLMCLGIGGMAGMFLWPVIPDLYRRRCELDQSPSCDGAFAFRQQDLHAAPAIAPMIGTCFTVAWFIGMVVTTPMYHPYPRLSLPLLMSLWLAAAGGVGWWMEANLNTHRRREDSHAKPTSWLQRLVQGMAIAALALTVSGAGRVTWPRIWENRTSLRDASWHLAKTMIDDAVGTFQKPRAILNVNSDGVISPDPDIDEDDPNARDPVSSIEQLRSRIATPFDSSSPLAELSQPECVVYTFGEPAVLAHLNAAGVMGVPVQDLDFPSATWNGHPLVTYFVLGPNALRTDGMLDLWATAQHRFEHIADFHFAPGDVVLYNLFSPEWVGQHYEASVQKLELYRLKTE